jgi:YHS domain-containing protein
MSRIVIYLIIFAVIYWVIKRALFPAKSKMTQPKETAEELVQDPVCKCYIPKSQSYALSFRGKKLFFCSEECYNKYMASHGLPKG